MSRGFPSAAITQIQLLADGVGGWTLIPSNHDRIDPSLMEITYQLFDSIANRVCHAHQAKLNEVIPRVNIFWFVHQVSCSQYSQSIPCHGILRLILNTVGVLIGDRFNINRVFDIENRYK